jgi:hypothetical protein
MKRIEDELTHPGQFRIEKQDWRPRSMYEMELGAENVIYMLVDEKAKLLYAGSAGDRPQASGADDRRHVFPLLAGAGAALLLPRWRCRESVGKSRARDRIAGCDPG